MGILLFYELYYDVFVSYFFSIALAFEMPREIITVQVGQCGNQSMYWILGIMG